MQKVHLRGSSDTKCSRCRSRLYEVSVDGIALCEECLVKAVLATSGDPDAARNYEIGLLVGDLARLTGRTYRVHRGLATLPNEEVLALRRAIRDIEDMKSHANRKLRQFGLPGV